MVGDLLHDRRDRDQHADVHRRARVRLRRQLDVPAARRRLRDRPDRRQPAVPAALFSRRAGDVVPAPAAAIRHVGQHGGRGIVPADPVARRRHPPVRHRPGHLDRHRRPDPVDGGRARRRDDRLHRARRFGGGHLDGRRPDVRVRGGRAGRVLRAASEDSGRLERSRRRRNGRRKVHRHRSSRWIRRRSTRSGPASPAAWR